MVKIAGRELPVTKERPSTTCSVEKDSDLEEDSRSESYPANRSPVQAGSSETDYVERDDMLARSVFIENVPPDMCEFLEVVIESKNSGGGPVEVFEPDPARGGVLVRFVDQQGFCSACCCI